MEKRYIVWFAVVVALMLPAAVLAQEENMDLALAYNDNLGRQGALPIVATGSQVYYPSGTYYFSETDLKVAARSVPMIWERTYRSNRVIKGNDRYVFAEPVDGPLGYGWTTPFTVRIENDAFVNAEGRYIFFVKDANGTYLPNQEAGQILKKTAEGYELTELGGNTHLFNLAGKLTAIRDTRGHAAILTYDAAGRLVAIADVMGREIFTFSYTAENRIARITDLAGRSIDYGYDGFGNLELVAHNGEVLARYAYSTYHGITSKANVLDETYTIEYQYADKGVVSKVIDPEGTARLYAGLQPTGHLMSFQYDFPNRVYYVTDQLGVVRKYTLNSAGKVTSSSEIIGGAEQPKETIEYLENRTTKTTDALGNAVLTQRDEWGNVIKKIDAEGFEWRYTYNTQGKLTSETDPLGTVNRYEYDEFGNKVKEIVAAGTKDESAKQTVYNEYNELIAEIIDGEARTYRYDVAGNLTQLKDPLGNVTTMNYDQMGNLLTSTLPLIGTTAYANYDYLGNPGRVTKPNGNSIISTYDLLGRVTTVTNLSDGGVTKYYYSSTTGGNCTSCGGGAAVGKVSKVVYPEGNSFDYRYDNVGKLTYLIDAESNSTVYTYDVTGNKIKEEVLDSKGTLLKQLSFQYDKSDRLVKIINPDDSYAEIEYDQRGNKKSVKDPIGNTTAYVYDSLNRATKIIQPGNILTVYVYDQRGNIASVTDANGNKTTYSYDRYNRLAKVVSHDTGTTTYTYDSRNLLKTKVDAEGVTATYDYDAAKRLISISFPDPVDNIDYEYDSCLNGKGQLCKVTDPSGFTSYEYTAKGQIAKENKNIDGQTFSVEYVYDKNGNVTSQKYPSGKIVSYGYSANNRVANISVNGEQIASSITYQPFGEINGLTYGSGMQHSVDYDQQYRIVRIVDSGIQNVSYRYDRNGNITTIEDKLDPSESRLFGYDTLYRLITAQGPWGNLSYSYDAIGNRTKQVNNGENNYSFVGNRPISVTGKQQATFNYSAIGGLKEVDSRRYVYNQNQRLIRVEGLERTVGSYLYNAKGQRVKKTVGVDTVYFFYDKKGKLISEYGANQSDYIFLNGKPFVKIDGDEIYYIHNDHLGTPQKITYQGDIVWNGSFMPFGETVSITESVENNLRFPGQYYDAETRLNYNYFRYYNPDYALYLRDDPISLPAPVLFKDVNFQMKMYHQIKKGNQTKFSSYRYASQNPVNLSDVLGLVCGSDGNDWIIPDYPGGYDFTGACQAHDDCYGRCGSVKGQCDKLFYTMMMAVCAKELSGSLVGAYNFADCMARATIYYGAVDLVGKGSYNDAQKKCKCP